MKIDFLKYLTATALGIIPSTVTITLIISRIKMNIDQNTLVNIEIINDPIFIISVILIILLAYLFNIINKKYFK